MSISQTFSDVNTFGCFFRMRETMNNILAKGNKSELDKKNLKNSDYTRSLISEAFRCGKLSQWDMQGLKDELHRFFQKIASDCSDFTDPETASKVLAGQFFITDVYLRSLETPEKALEAFVSNPPEFLRNEGLKLLKKTAVEAMTVFVKVKQSRLNINNDLYDKTLSTGLKNALKEYNCEYFPHDIDMGEVYPVFSPPLGLKGIFYLKAYLLSLALENEFCKAFDQEELYAFYNAFCENAGVCPGEYCGNIYSAVYANALFCEYLKKDPGTLKITSHDCYVIEKLLGHMSESESRAILQRCAELLPYGRMPYNSRTLMKLLPGIFKSIRHKKTNKYLVVTD